MYWAISHSYAIRCSIFMLAEVKIIMTKCLYLSVLFMESVIMYYEK